MKQTFLIAFSLLVVAAALYLRITNPGELNNDLMETTRTISSFIFGALFAYYLDNSKDKHNLIMGELRKDDALMIGIYKQIKYFDEKTQEELKKLIDNYLQSQIDYFLSDYHLTSKEFMNLYDFIQDIEPKNSKEEKAKDLMFSFLNDSLQVRKCVEANTRNTISLREWITLYIFALIILLTTIVLYNGSLGSIVLTALLSFGIVILLFLLYQIDSLKWKQDEYIWLPLSSLFKELSLLPYFPKKILKKRKINGIKGEIRVVTYPNRYPDCSGKKIDIVMR